MFTHFAFVGCRTTRERNARGLGISCFGVGRDGRWTPLSISRTLPNPSFLAADRAGRTLYAVHGDTSEMTSLRIEGDGTLHPLQSLTVAGQNPVDVVLDPAQRFAIVTNHLSDGLVVRRRLDDGTLGEIVGYHAMRGRLGPHRVEQTGVKPHQARFFPDGRFLAVPNKGADTVSVLELERPGGALRAVGEARFREGSGPRNLVFHPTLGCLYVICELDSTVCAFAFCRESGALTPLQVRSCRRSDAFGLSRGAAIVVSPDGTRLFATNRGDDCVAEFALSPQGALGEARFYSTLGRTPRFACMDLDGSSLLVANEDTDTIVRLPACGGEGAVVATSESPVSIVFVAAATRP